MLQRARDALRPDNSVAPVQAAIRVAPLASGSATPPADPEAVRRRYYVQERGPERRYFDDYRGQALAFRASADQVASKREDLNTIRSMLDVAEARGWRELSLKGTGAFRREAWIEATSRGLQAQGHRATDLDRQEAERRQAQRRPPQVLSPVNAVSPSGPPAAPPPSSVHRTPEPVLSADAQLVLRAVETKIEASMRKLTSEAKTELKAFAATQLAQKERREGQVALTPRQRAAAPSTVRLVQRRPDPAATSAAAPPPPEHPEQRVVRRR